MHVKNRYLSNAIDKKRKILPLVGILGARQVGKSTLLRDLIGKASEIPYFTLDRQEVLREARRSAENFILSRTDDFKNPVIIDEAHKAPALFDALKVLADERKTRGIVLLTGSVDFSLAAGVRETLTGRLGVCRLHPLTVGEIAQRGFLQPKATLKEVDAWIERGGMPAICQIRTRVERDALIEEWLQAVCYRDLLQLKGARYDPVIAREVLNIVARLPDSSQSDIAHEMGEDSRVIAKHLRGLEALFVINQIRPYKRLGCSGATRFQLFDSAVARYLGATVGTCRGILLVNEFLARFEYSGNPRPSLAFLARRGHTKIDLIVEEEKGLRALVVIERAELDSYRLRSLKSLVGEGDLPKIEIVAPIAERMIISKGIEMVPTQEYC
jgi:predicted AAA+ superfamily ATPase